MTDLATVIEKLRGASTATLTTVLIKKGLRNVWVRGAMPLSGDLDERIVGPAFTLRFIPAREDLATPAAWASPTSTRAAIEAMPEGAVLVADAAGGVADAGIFGDILCGRMKVKGAAGVITDGAIRDAVGVLATELPVWCAGIAAPPSVTGLVFVGWEEPIGCGGVAIFPGDLIVADGDGAIVVPKDIAADVADEALEQEAFEAWVVEEVKKGTPLVGLYPPNAETQARYRAETGRG
jgi:regulator of RNase E activity RraA